MSVAGERSRDPPAGGGAARKQIRGSTLLLAGRGLGALVNLAVHVLMVRHLSVAEYGAFAFAMAAMVLVAHLVGLGLERGVSRYVPIYQELGEFGELAGTIALSIGSIAATGLFCIALAWLFLDVAGTRVGIESRTLSLASIFLCGAPLQALDDVAVRLFAIFTSPRALLVRRHLLTPGLRLAAVLAAIAADGDARFLAVAWVLGLAAGLAISAWVIAAALKAAGLLSSFVPSRIRIPARALFRFSLPLLSTTGLTAARVQLVVLLLGALHSAASVAAYRAVLPLANLNQIVFDSFKLLFSPAAARSYARGEHREIDALYWRSSAWIVLLSFPLLVGTVALSEPVAGLVLGESYAHSGTLLAVLAIGHFVHAAFGCNTLTLETHRAVTSIVSIDVAALLFSLAASVVLIPRFGALGAALGTSLTLALMNVLAQATLVRREFLRLIDADFLRVLVSVLAGTAIVAALQVVVAPPLVVSALLASGVGLLVLRAALPVMALADTFPELERFRLGRLLARFH
jgi:O-antigen/teichoic acid export membrane protein